MHFYKIAKKLEIWIDFSKNHDIIKSGTFVKCTLKMG